jgi:hypothetical protein
MIWCPPEMAAVMDVSHGCQQGPPVEGALLAVAALDADHEAGALPELYVAPVDKLPGATNGGGFFWYFKHHRSSCF